MSVAVPDGNQRAASGMRRRVAVGTRVESRVRSVCDEEGHRRWARGVVVGHDSTLDLPLVEWADEKGLSPEAVFDDEYEVAAAHVGMHLVRLGPPSDSNVIHRSSCRYAHRPNAVRWVWADDPANRAELKYIEWLYPCGHCRPYEKCLDPAALISR